MLSYLLYNKSISRNFVRYYGSKPHLNWVTQSLTQYSKAFHVISEKFLELDIETAEFKPICTNCHQNDILTNFLSNHRNLYQNISNKFQDINEYVIDLDHRASSINNNHSVFDHLENNRLNFEMKSRYIIEQTRYDSDIISLLNKTRTLTLNLHKLIILSTRNNQC